MLRPLACLLLLCLAPLASAQKGLSVSGRIEALSNPPGCAPIATHRLQNTNVYLVGSLIDLSTVPSTTQRFIGVDVSSTCPLFEVHSFEPAPISLQVCNAPALGCTVTLDMCPSPTSGSFVTLASTGNGYLPIGLDPGSFLLDPSVLVSVAAGAQTTVCQSSLLTLDLPPGFVGQDIYFQALTNPPSGAFFFSNLARITVRPPTVQCTNDPCF